MWVETSCYIYKCLFLHWKVGKHLVITGTAWHPISNTCTEQDVSSKGKIGQKVKNESFANYSALSLVENKSLLIDPKGKLGNVSQKCEGWRQTP